MKEPPPRFTEEKKDEFAEAKAGLLALVFLILGLVVIYFALKTEVYPAMLLCFIPFFIALAIYEPYRKAQAEKQQEEWKRRKGPY
jgi:uncharacterized membrane protein